MKNRRVIIFSLMVLISVVLVLNRQWNSSLFEKSKSIEGKIMANDETCNINDIKKRLTPLQYEVTQNEATEKPFHNIYWNNHAPGIYVDVVSGEPLFSSLDKYDSGTGWPSFTKPLKPENIMEKSDDKNGMTRTEIRSKGGNSHLGHLFANEPTATGLRYCINSAALRFVPAEELLKEGYSQFVSSFKKTRTVEIATFAGGCFWGMEEILRKIPGVKETVAGYTGGKTPDPTYDTIKKGNTGHTEAVQVKFDPARITYEQLLEYFFKMHDPTTLNRQGNDAGTQYRSVIFYHSEEQLQTAQMLKERVGKSGKWKKPIVTQIVPALTFYSAEEYHQKYLMKNPGGYTCHYLRD